MCKKKIIIHTHIICLLFRIINAIVKFIKIETRLNIDITIVDFTTRTDVNSSIGN